jgi:hypothetical protein
MTTRLSATPGIRLTIPLLFLALLAGCGSSRTELLEMELRDRERCLADLKACLNHKDSEIQMLEADLERLRREAGRPGGAIPSGLFVRKITLGRLTGGYAEDTKLGGDEGIQILLEPRDVDNQAIKAPGTVHVDLFEVTSKGVPVLLSNWDLSPKELRPLWDAPLFGGPSYRIRLPWKVWPKEESLEVVVQFLTPEGEKLQAKKEFTVRLPERPSGGKVCPPTVVVKPVSEPPPAPVTPTPAPDVMPSLEPPRLLPPPTLEPLLRRPAQEPPPAAPTVGAPPKGLDPPPLGGVPLPRISGSEAVVPASYQGPSPAAASAKGVGLKAPVSARKADQKAPPPNAGP